MTAYRFYYSHPGGGEFLATALDAGKGCSEEPVLAVIGADPAVVRVMHPADNGLNVSKKVEIQARRVLEPLQAKLQGPLSDKSPRIVRIGHVTLLAFDSARYQPEGHKKTPATALFVNSKTIPLGRCTFGHLFVSVNNTLYLTYWDVCCGCGERILKVYDLSGRVPKRVYQNGRLSD